MTPLERARNDLFVAAVVFARGLKEGEVVTAAHCEPLERAAMTFAEETARDRASANTFE
jgi:hypothetical protein